MGPFLKAISPVGNALGLFDKKEAAPRPFAAPAPVTPQRRARRSDTVKTGPLALGDTDTSSKTLLGG